ncbi:mortality factor 4-like protein 1 [Oppia nitens]|uniref:mortality factor 4-like protein 1 n=1 Tax=Oppia nitens TaxID=1686743 RepID=UPI0023DCC972|nr:mortality factor 4-like protein 1 [Oppia nitens]
MSVTTSVDPPSGVNFKYELEERVLCFHGPLIYEAKCLKRIFVDNSKRYYVHYNGWNKSWDEWVDESKILIVNETNLRKQQELKQNCLTNNNKQTANNNKKRKIGQNMIDGNGKDGYNETNKRFKSSTKNNGSKNGQNNDNLINTSNETNKKKTTKKRRMETLMALEESMSGKPDASIQIPLKLKPCLVDDWDLVTRQKMLYNLPANVSIDQILDDYVKHRVAVNGADESVLRQVVKGVKGFFNSMIGSQLLYKFERIQYQDLLMSNKEHNTGRQMSSIYGAFHLLRLFTRINVFLSYIELNDESFDSLSKHIHDLLQYLASKPKLFLSDDYSVASPEYCRKCL